MDGRPNRRDKAAFSNSSRVLWKALREFTKTTTATATRTSLNKRFNEQNNGSARAL